jgi:hypothetical protein
MLLLLLFLLLPLLFWLPPPPLLLMVVLLMVVSFTIVNLYSLRLVQLFDMFFFSPEDGHVRMVFEFQRSTLTQFGTAKEENCP